MKPQTILTNLILAASLLMATMATGQCILANPSFEIIGAGGAHFNGWNQFGAVGAVFAPYHGQKAARVSGPNSGTWDMSGFWQDQDCVPGRVWEITGHVLHTSANPLTGQNGALVNIEWRTGADELISYDTFVVAQASTPTDSYQDFSVQTSPAPAGTAKARLVVGMLQSPTDPSADVYFDQVTFFKTNPPTIDDIQWNDFPGGRTLDFGGHTWRVKGTGFYGPGQNIFSDAEDAVWVDGSGYLHLTLANNSGTWHSTEIATEQALGYGDYILTTTGRLDLLDPQAVLGIFLWEYGPCWDYAYLWWNPYNEIDIEYSRWENPGNEIAQFVCQPYNWPNNIDRFDLTFGEDEIVSHAMRWLDDRVEYRVWRGGPDEEAPENLVRSWIYTGFHIPRPEQPRMHLNLWRITGSPAADQEVVFTDFNFVPAGGVSPVVEGPDAVVPGAPRGRLQPAAPNPFNPQTTLRFTLDRGGFTELKIHDLNGKLVRTLVSETLGAGDHQAVWNGRDSQGRSVASGVYLSVLQGRDFLESRRMVLLK